MDKKTKESIPQQRITTGASNILSKGWELKSSGRLDEAEASFREAIVKEPKSVEGYFGLALTLKFQDRHQESIKNFEKVIELIDESFEDKVRGQMLKRLSKGHINQLSTGDWDLEKEIWKRDESYSQPS